MTYTFATLEGGPRWAMVKDGFTRASAAYAYALDWFREHGYEILCDDPAPDGERDIMVHRNGAMYQYAINKDRR